MPLHLCTILPRRNILPRSIPQTPTKDTGITHVSAVFVIDYLEVFHKRLRTHQTIGNVPRFATKELCFDLTRRPALPQEGFQSLADSP
jgi:hypothetical protein